MIDDYVYRGVVGCLDLSIERRMRFSGAIVIDDPIKPEDADQDVAREKVNSRFDSTIRNRVNSERTPIVVIMQRLHPRDLCGYLMRGSDVDEWYEIKLPCIKEDGSALWPFKESVEVLLRQKAANEVVFMRQKMQDPQPRAGLMFPVQDLRRYDMEEMLERLERPDFSLIAVDPANLGGDDFAAAEFKLLIDPFGEGSGFGIFVDTVIYNKYGTDYNEPLVVDMGLRNNSVPVS